MHTGLGLLRLAPDDFWSMTTREFAAAAAARLPPAQHPMNRMELENLMQEFPDPPKGEF